MPVAKQAVAEIMLPPRNALVLPKTDVLVVGGGPAGLGAALGAAEFGVKVRLIERYGFGGNATAGLVLTMASYYTSEAMPVQHHSVVTLFPTDHGRGRPIGGWAKLMKRLVDAGGALFQVKIQGL